MTEYNLSGSDCMSGSSCLSSSGVSGSSIVSGSVVVSGISILCISGDTGQYVRFDTQPYTITLYQVKQ